MGGGECYDGFKRGKRREEPFILFVNGVPFNEVCDVFNAFEGRR